MEQSELSDCTKDCLSLRERRAEAILDAAETLFVEQGYDGTSLAEIVKRSGGSLATLYQLFGNKQGLLHALTARLRDETNRLGGIWACPPDKPRADILIEFALAQIDKFTSPRAVALMKMLISEWLRDREFALQTYREIHLPMMTQLAQEFSAWNDEGTMCVDDPLEAARLFVSITTSDSMISNLTGVDDTRPDEAQLRWRLKPFLSYFQVK